ncbi:hypothetical protein GIB67_016115 [Kingdonia uniflora]|uniref:Uncharacterized protein n=1 Tax=Kingdonia uniflora TaxID=39325 RepID=A0A7J7L248_9MAGN|nr:hypothetical protein GIB67_016115 [Kingdonia uniflora]
MGNKIMSEGISSSRKLLTDSSSDATPIASPLKPLLAISSGKNENQAVVSKPSTVKAILKKIKQSPKKVNLVAALVRGMCVEDALLQMQVTVKRATQTVYQCTASPKLLHLHSVLMYSKTDVTLTRVLVLVYKMGTGCRTRQKNEIYIVKRLYTRHALMQPNHGLNPDRLIIAEAFVGKGFFQKIISYHAKRKCGVKVKPECKLTVIVREMTTEEEMKMARLRVEKYHRLSKRESRLVPHTLIETSSIWDRRSKPKPIGQGTDEHL